MNKFTAIIPVKKHSGRLKDKNILPFGDSNLLIHKIRQLKEVKEIDEIILSSDSDVMLEMGKLEDIKVIKRPYEFANESKPFGEFLEYIYNITNSENLIWACVTSPLVDSDLYSKAIDTYNWAITNGYDSLITVMKYQHFLLDENGPMNFKRGLEHVNSQELPMYHFFTNGINIAPRDKYLEWHYHWGSKPYRLEVDKRVAIDIDDIYDYEFAKLLYEKKSLTV